MASGEFGSSDTSDTSDISSTETSVTSGADEHFNRTGEPKPHIRKTYSISLTNISGQVAVGSRAAKIISQAKGEDTQELLQEASSASPGTSLYKTDGEYDRVPEENVICVEKHVSGSYCLSSHSQLQYIEREGDWEPKPSKGILISKGNEESWPSIQSFFDNPDRFIQEIDTSADFCKEQREQFILLKILPRLEESWGKCSSSDKEVYKILAKISYSVSSDIVVRHSLQLLFHLLCKENFRSRNDNLLVVEEIVRSAIFPTETDEHFKATDEHSQAGNLKLFVYSRILALLLLQLVRQDELPLLALENDLKSVHLQLSQRSSQLKNKKKDIYRYSMESILHMITRLLKRAARKLKDFVEECHKFCENLEMESKNLKILRTVKKKANDEWIDLHCILIHLHGKVHSERPVPQKKTERQAMKLIKLIVEAYLKGGGGGDWRFCLLATSILVDIAKNSMTKEMRTEAGDCLVNLLTDAKVRKEPDCRVIVERQSEEVLFCPDKETRKKLIDILPLSQEPHPPNLHTERLSSIYRTHALEINNTTIYQTSSCFVNHGMFQRRKVAIKILSVKKCHLLQEDPTFQARERLIQEVYNMRRLNASQHPNFPVLLGYDTKSVPYHLITVFERWGDLLQFVRMSRERNPYVQPMHLLRMLMDVSDALSYLELLGLVHRAVMAANVLVGENFFCKLSGLHSLRRLTGGTSKQDADLNSLEGYCSPLLVPEFMSISTDDDLPMRWKAPECLTKNRYSTASDVWAFGVLTYEVLTYGCIPYSHVLNNDEVHLRVVDNKEIVPQEKCIVDEEYDLIKKCCESAFQQRPKLSEINKRLKEVLQHVGKDESRPDPPPLRLQAITSEHSDLQDAEKIYSSIPEIPGKRKPKSIQEDEDESSVLYEEVREDLVKKRDEGSTMVWERITQDYQHVEELLALKNPDLAPVSAVDYWNSFYWIITPESANLKEFVLDRRCKQEDIVMFLSQVASALHYLHENHIVHGDLRAKYVNMIAPNKVQVGRLGRSKRLPKSTYEETSKSCVVGAEMPPDSTRWSAPEVILDGHYTHASDVWAFGILAWELYTSFSIDRRDLRLSVPYNGLYNHEILSHMREKGPLDRPEGCPDWVYIIMHQCWAYKSAQRPPFLAIYDCLTSREPMRSWIMELWKENHAESEWPDFSTRQSEDDSHVLDLRDHPSKKEIEKMCSDGFFAKHLYTYARTRDVKNHCSSEENLEDLEEEESFYSTPYSSSEDVSSHSCPVEKKADKTDDHRREWNHGHVNPRVVMDVESGNLNKEDSCQEEENLLQEENARGLFHSHGPSRTKRQNSTLQALFNNARVELEFYV